MDYIDKNDVLNEKRFSFRTNHETFMALIELVGKVTNAIEKKKALLLLHYTDNSEAVPYEPPIWYILAISSNDNGGTDLHVYARNCAAKITCRRACRIVVKQFLKTGILFNISII